MKIPVEELTTLRPASELKEVANTAVEETEKASIAYALNSAANCGQHEKAVNGPISDKLMEELKQQGYEIIDNSHAVKSGYSYIIRGF